MLADSPANALPLLLAADEKAYSTSEKPCVPGLKMPARPPEASTATAVPTSTSSGVTRIAMEVIFISNTSIFLPRYSGVRPIIRPAMNTARMAYTSMPYRPEPTPPKTTSPSWIRNIGTSPPSAVSESCIALTAPHEAAVVMVANSAEATMPKRVSLPSMLPTAWSTPRWASIGLACSSAHISNTASTTKRIVIEASTAQPWRRSPTIAPKVKHSAAGMRKIDSICTKLASGVGFSYGCAELALNGPPPLVPSILIASCEAIGPIGRVCFCVVAFSVTGLPCVSVFGLS